MLVSTTYIFTMSIPLFSAFYPLFFLSIPPLCYLSPTVSVKSALIPPIGLLIAFYQKGDSLPARTRTAAAFHACRSLSLQKRTALCMSCPFHPALLSHHRRKYLYFFNSRSLHHFSHCIFHELVQCRHSWYENDCDYNLCSHLSSPFPAMRAISDDHFKRYGKYAAP